MDSNSLSDKTYQGYSSCPLVTGYGKMVLAEFDYNKNFTPDPKLKQLFISDSSKEHWRLWMLKKYNYSLTKGRVEHLNNPSCFEISA